MPLSRKPCQARPLSKGEELVCVPVRQASESAAVTMFGNPNVLCLQMRQVRLTGGEPLPRPTQGGSPTLPHPREPLGMCVLPAGGWRGGLPSPGPMQRPGPSLHLPSRTDSSPGGKQLIFYSLFLSSYSHVAQQGVIRAPGPSGLLNSSKPLLFSPSFSPSLLSLSFSFFPFLSPHFRFLLVSGSLSLPLPLSLVFAPR